MVSGQATQPDTQADCPDYDSFSGRWTQGFAARNLDYGQLRRRRARTRRAGSTAASTRRASRPCSTNSMPRTSAGRATRRISATPTNAAGPAHDAGTAVLRRSVRAPGATGSTAQANPGSANATDQYVPKHFPFPWFDSILQSGDCDSAHIANLFDPSDGLYHDLQHEIDDAGVQLDLAEQLQRRSRRGLPWEQPLRRVLRSEHAERADQLHRRARRGRSLPRARRARDREVARVQGGRPDRHHVRRGFPAVHLHRQQLRQLHDRRARTPRPRSRATRRARRCSATPFTTSRPGRTRRSPRTRTAMSCTRAPVTTRSSTGPPTASRRPCPRSPPAPASSAAAPVAGSTHRAAATAAAGTSTIADNAIVATDVGRAVTGPASPRRFRRPGDRRVRHRRPVAVAAASSTPARSRWSTGRSTR